MSRREGRAAQKTGRRKSGSRDKALSIRRERRRRRVVFWVSGLILLAVAGTALYTFVLRDLSVFEVRDLQVVGVDRSSAEGRQVNDAIEVAVGEMTTLNLKQGLLDSEMARFPRVQSTTVSADFPNGATVTVVERQDGSIYGAGANAQLIATDGTVLGSPGDQVDALPLIQSGDPPVDGRLEGGALEQALVLGAVPRELRSYVDTGDFGPDGVEVTLSNGLRLLFGDSENAEEKWKAAASVIADPNLSDAGYVDLSVPRRPAVGAGESPQGG